MFPPLDVAEAEINQLISIENANKVFNMNKGKVGISLPWVLRWILDKANVGEFGNAKAFSLNWPDFN